MDRAVSLNQQLPEHNRTSLAAGAAPHRQGWIISPQGITPCLALCEPCTKARTQSASQLQLSVAGLAQAVAVDLLQALG
jgi:hypothetical protein